MHTPGPWEVHKCKRANHEKEYSPFEILQPLINEEGEYKGKLGGYQVIVGRKNCLPGYILGEADAHLIADSPDLLDSLVWAVGQLENYGIDADIEKLSHKGMAAELEKARNLIMKHKGGN